ncbi:MAG: hypothetical protein C0501_11435 [Isosphaera sp.]|nr:hypothetical protein [Isosphaera sp.]
MRVPGPGGPVDHQDAGAVRGEDVPEGGEDGGVRHGGGGLGLSAAGGFADNGTPAPAGRGPRRPPVPTPAPGPKRLDFLDAARAAAATLVLVDHGLQVSVPGYLAWSLATVVASFGAVLLFFLVSGFVIPMSLEAGGSTRTFWVRRAFRLYPVYWVSLALAAVYLAVDGRLPVSAGQADPGTWVANLFLAQGAAGRPDIWGVYWSLHFELVIYAACSALFACGLLRRVGARTIGAVLAGYALACAAKPLVTGRPPSPGDARLVVLVVLFGLLAHRYLAGRVSRRAFGWLSAAFPAVVVAVWGVHRLRFPEVATAGNLARLLGLLGAVMGAFLALMALRDRRMPGWALWLGHRSYPIYLTHPFVLLVLTPFDWPAWALVPVLAAATLVLSDLAHRYVERPGMALGRRLTTRRREVAPAAAEPVPARRAA